MDSLEIKLKEADKQGSSKNCYASAPLWPAITNERDIHKLSKI